MGVSAPLLAAANACISSPPPVGAALETYTYATLAAVEPEDDAGDDVGDDVGDGLVMYVFVLM